MENRTKSKRKQARRARENKLALTPCPLIYSELCWFADDPAECISSNEAARAIRSYDNPRWENLFKSLLRECFDIPEGATSKLVPVVRFTDLLFGFQVAEEWEQTRQIEHKPGKYVPSAKPRKILLGSPTDMLWPSVSPEALDAAINQKHAERRTEPMNERELEAAMQKAEAVSSSLAASIATKIDWTAPGKSNRKTMPRRKMYLKKARNAFRKGQPFGGFPLIATRSLDEKGHPTAAELKTRVMGAMFNDFLADGKSETYAIQMIAVMWNIAEGKKILPPDSKRERRQLDTIRRELLRLPNTPSPSK